MEFEFVQVVPASPDDIFAFHENPLNLTRLLCDWPRFQLLSCDTPMRPGGVMWVQESFLAIPVALGFHYTIHRPPYAIGGELFHGPFERFAHTHEFSSCAGGTRVCDRLDVAVPARFGGDFMLRRFVAPLLRRAFDCRQRALREIACAGRWRSAPDRAAHREFSPAGDVLEVAC